MKRLRAGFRNLNIQFAENMRLKGQAHKIVDNECTVVMSVDGSSDDSPKMSHEELCREVANNLKRNRGSELLGLGTFNPLMIRDLFVNQASPTI